MEKPNIMSPIDSNSNSENNNIKMLTYCFDSGRNYGIDDPIEQYIKQKEKIIT